MEDTFIDEMAMGPLLWKDSRHKLLAGSVEGVVAELIQVNSTGHFTVYVSEEASASNLTYRVSTHFVLQNKQIFSY